MQWTLAMVLVSLALVALPSRWKLEIPVTDTLESDVGPPLPATAPRRTTPGEHAVFRADATPPANIAVESAVAPAGPRSQWQRSSARGPAPLIRPASITSAVTVVYLFGCLVFFMRWAKARIRLQQLYRAGGDAPSTVRRELTRIAGNRSNSVRLRMSDAISTPITWNAWRPVIMLPQAVLAEQDNRTLRYYLAHEWAHVRRRDWWTWQLAACLQFFLYYHPLYWRVRRDLSICMDRLADAEASSHGASSADYAAFLVQLARSRRMPSPQLTLGVNDKQSALRQRIEFLLCGQEGLRMMCPRGRSTLFAVAAMLIGVMTSTVRIGAQATADEDPETEVSIPDQAAPLAADAESHLPDSWPFVKQLVETAKPQIAELLKHCMREHVDGSITYLGFVTDAVAEKPIPEATVSIIRKLSRDPETGGWRTLETTEHQTNAFGFYSFVLPPQQASQSSLYVEVEARHPDYASKGRSGYSHAMIRKNLKLGELPFYTQIKLWPGEAIEGTVVSPDGAPLEDVEISMYAASDKSQSFPRGSFDKTATGADGKFRIVPPTPGDGVLWVKPARYSPQAHRIGERRGDWGRLTVAKGATIRGQILDVDSKPVANVRIEARRSGDGEQADEFLSSNAVSNQIGRSTVSSETGEFTLHSLPDGDYRLQIRSNSDSYDPPPLEHVFLRESLTVVDGKSQQITIRSAPHVVLQGTYLDSRDQPRSGHEVILFGRIDDDFYFARSSTPGKDGKFELKIPHGLREAKLDLITNEHSALRWRMSRDEPLRRGRDVQLGTVEDDFYGFEVVRYVAPILLVKAVDGQGETVSDVTPLVTYTRAAGEDEEMTMYTTGGHVSFEAQGDGRHRSSQLLPDEPFSVTVKKDGSAATALELTLQEGEEREIEFELRPAATEDPLGQS